MRTTELRVRRKTTMTTTERLDTSAPSPHGGLRIGLLAPPWVSVPPSHYGGTEVVIDVLARGLQAQGHEVVLFATGDSSCPVDQRSVFAHQLGTDHMTAPSESRQVVAGYDALADCDIIHDHTFLGPLIGTAPAGIPVVATNHGPFLRDLRDVYRTMADREREDRERRFNR